MRQFGPVLLQHVYKVQNCHEDATNKAQNFARRIALSAG